MKAFHTCVPLAFYFSLFLKTLQVILVELINEISFRKKFIHFFDKLLLSTCLVLGTVQGNWDISGEQNREGHSLIELLSGKR